MECKTSRDFFCEYNSVIGMEVRYYLQGYKGTLITDGYQKVLNCEYHNIRSNDLSYPEKSK